MKTEIIKLTPEVARKMLFKNINNRPLNDRLIAFYAKQMADGLWAENGEPIIIDRSGLIKDGQHRLKALIKANFSYKVPLITIDDKRAMETIDTGQNRSLSDVLALNGFHKYTSKLAASITRILILKDGYMNRTYNRVNAPVTNSRGLRFAIQHKDELYDLLIPMMRLYNKSVDKVITLSDGVGLLYLINGFSVNDEILEFFESLYGLTIKEDTGCFWVRTKLLSFKRSHVSVSLRWKTHAIIKAWNLFAQGDPTVRRMVIKEKADFDDVIKVMT